MWLFLFLFEVFFFLSFPSFSFFFFPWGLGSSFGLDGLWRWIGGLFILYLVVYLWVSISLSTLGSVSAVRVLCWFTRCG